MANYCPAGHLLGCLGPQAPVFNRKEGVYSPYSAEGIDEARRHNFARL